MTYEEITTALIRDYPGAKFGTECKGGNFIIVLGPQDRFHHAVIGRLNRNVYPGYGLLQDQGIGRIAVQKVA